MTTGDIDALGMAADSGDPAAMTKLGKLALVGRAGPRSAEDGAGLLAAAAEAGDAEADAVIAVLIGTGAKSPADWALALDYLGRSAARGWPTARQQYALLCADRELARQSELETPPSDIWRRMNKHIDIAALTRPAPERIVFETPRIAVIEQFASAAECAWMIARARPRIARADVFDRERGGKMYEKSRTNSAVMFDILESDLVLVLLQARIAAATGLPARHLEETNVLHYAKGQEFLRHYDFFDPGHAAFQSEIAEKGQRAVTFLIYLNEEFEGGETEFAKLDWRYRGRPGDALVFRNLDPSGAPDMATLHAGLAPLSGEKWLLSQWIRSRTPGHAK